MKIGIIGAGKVGTTLGKYLVLENQTVTGYYSKTPKSGAEAAAFTGTKCFQTLGNLVEASDTLFVTTPDGVIAEIWDCIAKMDCDLSGYTICHFSGSLSSNVFSGIEQTGAKACSIHPMYAFSDKYTSYKEFHTAYLTAEGDAKAIVSLFQAIGHTVFSVNTEGKAKYHAAASMASNFMIGLMQTSLDLLKDCGFSCRDAMALLRPLVENNISAMLDKGCESALTGPVERGDIETVRKHLQVLQGSQEEMIYRTLGGKLLELAQQKNPDRNYTALENLLKKS